MEKHEKIFPKKSFVVIAGDSRGLGRYMALKFAGKFPPGSVFVLMARGVKDLESVRTEMIASVPKLAVLIKHYDQGNTESGYFDGIFDNILAENKLFRDDFGQAVIVHNCATTGDVIKTSLQMNDPNDVRSYFDINLVGMILLNTSFFTTFSDSAQSRIIVNITSGGSNVPTPSPCLYCAGKAARDMFFRVLATEEPSIRILTYAPGGVDTEMLRDLETNTCSEPLRKFFQEMVKTKTTPRKEQRCPMCAFTCTDLEAMKSHIVKCGLREMEKKSFICNLCQFATTSTSNLLRHTKRRHSSEQAGPSTENDDQQSDRGEVETWQENDLCDLSSIIGNVSDSDNDDDNDEVSADKEQEPISTPDPTVRTPTRPGQVFTQNRVAEKLSPKDSRNCIPQKVPRVDRPPADVHKTPTPVRTTTSSVYVQTHPVVHRRVVWKTTRYIEDGRDIEVVEMDETESFCGVCGAKN